MSSQTFIIIIILLLFLVLPLESRAVSDLRLLSALSGSNALGSNINQLERILDHEQDLIYSLKDLRYGREQIKREQSRVNQKGLDIQFERNRVYDQRNLINQQDRLNSEQSQVQLSLLNSSIRELERELLLIEERQKAILERDRLEEKIIKERAELAQLASPDKIVAANNTLATASISNASNTENALLKVNEEKNIEFNGLSQENIELIIAIAQEKYSTTTNLRINDNPTLNASEEQEAFLINQGELKDQFEFLLFLLERGVNSSGNLPTYPLSHLNNKPANFVVVSYPNETLMDRGINKVFLSQLFYHVRDFLTFAYPQINFINLENIDKSGLLN